MRIGLDGKRIIQNFTGLGNYGRFVLKVLAKKYPYDHFTVFSAKPANTSVKEAYASFSNVSFHSPRHVRFSALWRTLQIIQSIESEKIDLYHGLSNELPWGIGKTNVASVLTVHDLIFLRFPHYYKFIDRQIYKFKMAYSLRNTDRIIAISEQTKKDLITFFDIDESRIDVVYQGCDPSFGIECSEEDKARVRSGYQLPDTYLLNVGTIEPRKNLLLIAKALKNLPDDIHLVAIGKQRVYTQKVKSYLQENSLTHRVHFYENVPLSDLPAIYQQAKLFIYPSEYEGFGIPIIEALHSKIPVIAARGSCLEEAGGPSSKYVDPQNEKELSDCILSILQYPAKAELMVEKGLAYVGRFSDERIAESLMQVYEKAVHQKLIRH